MLPATATLGDTLLSAAIQEAAYPLEGAVEDYDPLLEMIGDARLVLIGEASHGTHEFYRERAEITKRLIREKAFTAVAVEADWPDAYRVNCYVRGLGQDSGANQSLSGFKRFPTWMWRNTEMLKFVGWLRAYNAEMPRDAVNVGFYGLDLYSLHASMEAVLHYLEKVDPEAAQRARYRYGCFDQFDEDTQAYGYAASFGLSPSCEAEVVNQLLDLQQHAAGYARDSGGEDAAFFAEQNARLVKNAEEYYRTMFLGHVESWNLRDQHMAETLEALITLLDNTYLDKESGPTKVVVWEHNSHLGDARATAMGRRGELNVGQLVRERYQRDAVLIGFTTYGGTVTAASDWGKPAECKRVRPALSDSYEALFHSIQMPRFLLPLRDDAAPSDLLKPRLERAIGVIYRPETERLSHYFQASLPAQFDAVIHIDQTIAVEPLEPTAEWHKGEVPETFPSGV